MADEFMDNVSNNSPDDGVEFELTDEKPAVPVKRDYARDANLVLQLSAEEQEQIVGDVIDAADLDWRSGAAFRKRRVRQVELFAGIMPEKPPGHEKIAQIHLSIIAQSVLILHATIHGQLFPPTNNIYGARAVRGGIDGIFERVRRLGWHLNWQVTTRIVEYLPANDRGMMQWLIYGTMFDCWYYDPIEQRPCYEVIQTDDLIMPYTSKSVRYDLADVPRKTRKLKKYQHEIEQLRDANGFWVNVEKLWPEDKPDGAMLAPEKVSDDKKPMQKAQDKIQGQEDQNDPNGPRLFLDQHTWLKLPGEKSQRPVIVTVDYDKKVMVRLVLREDEDPRDRTRFERDMEAHAAHIQAQQAEHQAAMSDWQSTVDTLSQPQPVLDDMGSPQMDEMGGALVQPPAPPESLPPQPTPPQEPPPPPPIRMVPVEWFTKYGCIPNPEGIYDFGVGYLLEGDNIAADTLMSQYVSALTLSIFPTLFYSQMAKLKRGDTPLRLGEAQESPLHPQLLKDAFFQLQFQAPPNSVQKLIEQREESGRQLVGASNILTGDTGAPNETATSVQIRTNSARMNLAEMGNRFNNARASSLKNLARLNAKTLDPVEYFSVTMPGAQDQPPQAEQIAREDYLEPFQVTFTCDPRLASQPQRVQDALNLMTQVLQIPPGALFQPAHQQVIKMAFVGYLKALDRDDMAAIIEQSPVMPPQPPPGAPPNGKPGEPAGKKPPPGNVGGTPPGPAPDVGPGPGHAPAPQQAGGPPPG